jgi:hypothetical protein
MAINIWVMVYLIVGFLIAMWALHGIDVIEFKEKCRDWDAKFIKRVMGLTIICIWPAYLVSYIRGWIKSREEKKNEKNSAE